MQQVKNKQGKLVEMTSKNLHTKVFAKDLEDKNWFLFSNKERNWEDKEAYSKKILLTEDDLKSKGNVVQVVNFPPKTKLKPHYHKQTKEIFYILKEGGIISIDDEQIRAQNDDILFCEPGEKHFVINDTDEEFRIEILHDRKDFAKGLRIIIPEARTRHVIQHKITRDRMMSAIEKYHEKKKKK